MKRQIKFRGKSINNGKWLYGYLGEVKGKVLQSIYKEKVIFENLEWFNTDNFGYVVNDYMVDEETIGQFTGLYDEMGKEIYEGDILKFFYIAYYSHFDAALKVYRTGEVAFVDGCFRLINLIDYDGIDLKKKSELQPCKGYDMEFHSNFCSVIGNIHDNKDLLNKE